MFWKHITHSALGLSLAAGCPALAGSGDGTPTKDEIRAIVSEMMADAQTRSSLLRDGASAGHDGGFYLADTEGNFRLNVEGQLQFRYTANFGDGNASDGGDYTGGFENTRTKLAFTGNVINEKLFYRIQGSFGLDNRDFSDNNSDFTLEDAYVGYAFDNGLALIWGQLKAPFLREELVSSRHQLAADRSLMHTLFSATRTQGVALAYTGEDWKGVIGFTDGANAANTRFTNDTQIFTTLPTSAPLGGEADFSVTARVDFKLAGDDWARFDDFTSMPGQPFAAMIGVAGHLEGNETLRGLDAGTTGDVLVAGYTADISLEGDGWNFFAAFAGFSSDIENVADPDGNGVADDVSVTDFGVVAQGGVFIPGTDVEVFARYDGIFLDDDARPTNDEFNTVTVGANWYWAGHAAKFTLDAQIFLDESRGAGGVPVVAAAGPLDSSKAFVGDDDDGEVAIRAQFQLLF